MTLLRDIWKNKKDILEGVYNNLVLSDEVKALKKSRLSICNTCPKQSNNAKSYNYKTRRLDIHCIECGCNLDLKTACLHCECPLSKWSSVVTKEESNRIDEILNNDNKEHNGGSTTPGTELTA